MWSNDRLDDAGTRFSRARCRRWELWELLWRTYPSYVESCARNVVSRVGDAYCDRRTAWHVWIDDRWEPRSFSTTIYLNSTANMISAHGRPRQRRLCQSRGGVYHRPHARSRSRADGVLANFLTYLAPRCVLVDALPAFLSLCLPDVLVSLVLSLVPFMRNAFTHEDDEDLAAIRVLVGSVQFVPAEDVVAGTKLLPATHMRPLSTTMECQLLCACSGST